MCCGGWCPSLPEVGGGPQGPDGSCLPAGLTGPPSHAPAEPAELTFRCLLTVIAAKIPEGWPEHPRMGSKSPQQEARGQTPSQTQSAPRPHGKGGREHLR